MFDVEFEEMGVDAVRKLEGASYDARHLRDHEEGYRRPLLLRRHHCRR